jgi:tRNA dimethylallyltransferase
LVRKVPSREVQSPVVTGWPTANPPRLLVITGATCSGKSEAALGLAPLLAGEILSADSMQVYRGMDIGTAKPSAAERAQVRHHLLDVVNPAQPFSVAAFKDLADQCVEEVNGRGGLPIMVGGTGLYVRAVVENYDLTAEDPAPDLRERWRAVAAQDGAAALHARLRAVDPVSATRIHENDMRRVVRALEVFERTGHPISASVDRTARRGRRYDVLQFAITWPRDELHRRIDRRVDRMLDLGLVDEVDGLRRGCGLGPVAAQALGYREILAYLEGHTSLGEAASAIKTATRRLAKRQLTWFRAQDGLEWIAADPATWPDGVVAVIVSRVAERWTRMYNRG